MSNDETPMERRIITRIDGLQGAMEASFAEVEARLEAVERGLANVALVLVNHLADHARGEA